MNRNRAALLFAALLLAGCGKPDPRIDALLQKQEELDRQVAALEQADRQLRDTVQELQARPPDDLTNRVAEIVGATVDALVAARIDALVDEGLIANIPSREQIQSVMAQELATRETETEREEEERRRRWREQAEERRREWEQRYYDKLAADLALTDGQQEQVRQASQNLQQSIRDTMAQMREEGTFSIEEVRTAVAKLKAQNDEAMRGILDEEQFQSYQTRGGNVLGFLADLLGKPQTTE